MNEWMKKLAEHHGAMREAYPRKDLIVVFDIDDTILDLRHMILHVLRSFDLRHGTSHFHGLALRDIRVSERAIDRILEARGIPKVEMPRVIDWFTRYSWSLTVTRGGHRPFPGVMDVIRWLQTQPHTSVGLNTGRPECLRRETLQCLHDLGRPHGARFADTLLHMNPYGWGQHITDSKVEGIAYFQSLGYRVAAFIDNEPENLRAVEEYDTLREILLLHADTVFDSDKENVPRSAVSGRIYNIVQIMGAEGLGRQFGKAA